ncbi:hypothetical protein ACFVAJ_17670 [Agromyces sp. NPDC057679]|uniref:hypothetical protein n=1 Tax=Agromyces sp. NPDC057679 TaxID=3346207 RepID=UPI0036726F5E
MPDLVTELTAEQARRHGVEELFQAWRTEVEKTTGRPFWKVRNEQAGFDAGFAAGLAAQNVAARMPGREPCPKNLTWSAFGATYPDTYCVDGLLYDADSNLGGEISCPFCDPVGFTDYQFGGGYVIPLCSHGEHRIPNGTPIHYHDGDNLWWTADCLEHGEQRILWRDLSNLPDFDDDAFIDWSPRPAGN